MKQIIITIAALFSVFYSFAQNDSISRERELKEVVVTATRPLTKFDSDGIVTTVVGTPLQSLETVSELLGYIPGVFSNNGSIEVIGKGQPVIYINGRKLRNLTELGQLPAAKVKEVKVINNPGAKYGGDVNAVIRISTVKDLGDGFSLDSRVNAGVREYVFTKEFLNLNYRTGGLDIFADAEYNYSKNKGFQSVVQNFFGNNERTYTSNASGINRNQMLNGKIGVNYSAGSKHVFGAFYQHIYKPSKTTSSGNSEFIFNELVPVHSDVTNNEKEKYYEHLVDAYYSGIWGTWMIDASFDFLWRKTNADQQNREVIENLTSIDMMLKDKSNGRMFAGELNVTKRIGNGNLQFGAEYTNTNRTEDFQSDISTINSLNNKIGENNVGVYGQISQTFGILTLQAGLRYEHINSSYFVSGEKKLDQSRSYNEFLPSVSMVLPVKQTMFQLGYSRKYNRPLYSQLSSTVLYMDQYTYETGNPNLRNTFTDNVSLNFMYKWLMVTAAYKHLQNQVITVCSEYPSDPDITLLKKENSKNDINNLEMIVSATPGFIGNFYYPIAVVGVVSQFYDIDFRGGVKHMNTPMVLVRLNNIFRLPQNFMIYANLNYRSDSDGENIHMGHAFQFDLSVAKSLSRNWDIRLSFNDIFNTARKIKATIYSGMYEINTAKYKTLRSIELSIGYKFNTTRSKYKGKGAGNNEKDRL